MNNGNGRKTETTRRRLIIIMIHEQQVRQLCAIHAVNNLLQLPPDLDYDSLRGDEVEECAVDEVCGSVQKLTNASIISHEWTCRERILCRYYEQFSCKNDRMLSFHGSIKQQYDDEIMTKKNRPKRYWRAATQQEFDDIAHKLTLREQMLTSGDESAILSNDAPSINEMNSRESHKNISLMQRICSDHGTPYFGNYSIEVLQEALIRRGIELEYYRVPKDGACPATVNENADDVRGAASTSTSKCLIGYILNTNTRPTPSPSLLRIGKYIPIVKHFCDAGRHWYAITGVQYKQNPIPGNVQSENSPTKQQHRMGASTTSSWSLIDSKVNDVSIFYTNNELMDFISYAQQHKGCLVFGAYFTRQESSR